MSFQKFITDMLNIESDKIEHIEPIDMPNGDINVKIKLVKSDDVYCPICKGNVTVHGYYPRKLIHSTFVNRKCTITYYQRRYRCSSCEFSFHEKNPFSKTNENVTYETKINVLKDLKYPYNTYTAVAKRYNLSVTQVQRIFDHHVDIKRKELPEVLSIDEHYFPESSYDSLYLCILMNFDTGEIVDVLPDRKKDYLIHYFSNIRNSTLNEKTHTSELDQVKYVSIDLYKNYKDIAQTYFPKAIICADSFHVLEHLTKDFNSVRTRCRGATEDAVMQYLLIKFKNIFNTDINLDNRPKYNKRLKRYVNYRQIMGIIFERFPELKLAYELKEEYIQFNRKASTKNAADKLNVLIAKFANCNIKEYDEFNILLSDWYQEIINSFTIYNNKRINNSYIESRNRSIEKLLYNANGFVNFKRTRNRILYCLNKNDSFTI